MQFQIFGNIIPTENQLQNMYHNNSHKGIFEIAEKVEEHEKKIKILKFEYFR